MAKFILIIEDVQDEGKGNLKINGTFAPSLDLKDSDKMTSAQALAIDVLTFIKKQ